MSMNLIAILVSLAMMLTGAGADGQPAGATRTLTLSNVNVSYNGQSLRLAPEAHWGVSTDGQRALYDFGVTLDGQKLMPVQLLADDTGVTLRSVNGDVAARVTGEALEGLAARAQEQMGLTAQAEGVDNELMRFLTEEYLPAYTAVLRTAMDPEATEAISAACEAVYDANVDRGEGTPVTVDIDGESYDLTEYRYTLDGQALAKLSDAIYREAGQPVLKDYYDALFRLYALLPEESGLTDVDSMEALFAKVGIDTKLDLVEQRSGDGAVAVTDGTLSMAGAALEADGLEPMAMKLHGVKMDNYTESDVSASWAMEEGQGMDIELMFTRAGAAQELEGTLYVTRDGQRVGGGRLFGFYSQDDAGEASYSLSLRVILQDEADFEGSFYGARTAQGLSENTVSLEVRTPEAKAGVSFDLNVTDAPIEDVAGGGDAALVIDDLSPEGLEALSRNPALVSVGMKALSALSLDAEKLMGDGSVKDALALFRSRSLPIDVDALAAEDPSYEYDFEGGDDGFEIVLDDASADDDFTLALDGEDVAGEYGDEAPAEDDGVLGFEIPRLTWLPKGWTATVSDSDTVYDWVELTLADADGAECGAAIFFPNPEAETANYIVQADGKVAQGRMINVTDFGEGGLSVTVTENGMYGNLMLNSEAIELDTIGRIVAGIEF